MCIVSFYDVIYEINESCTLVCLPRICTNNSSWTEKILSLEVLPDSISKNLRRVHDILVRSESSCNGLELLLGSTSDSSKRTDMMKFLRNAILLCLTAFPRNHILEEAALVAEEFSVVKTDSSTPCRALAKSLLKNDRQVFFAVFHW